MANIDLDKIVGTDQFPNNENDVYALIETIASQRIMAVKSANRLIDATFDYVVENGRVIQEAVIEMAKSYTYDKSAYDRAPKDPTLHVRYFSDYTERQFEVTVRRDDVRKIIANKGEGVEDVIAQILATLTAGEGHEDFENVRALILNEYVPDYSAILGGVPKNIKGCIYAARNMYNHLKSDNSDLTEGAGTDDAYISATPAADIRVAVTESLLNLMDVVELANIFNLEKEELFGILVVVPDSDLDETDKYKIVVYDRKAMGRATFIYDFTQEEVAKGRFRNEYLTVSRAYFYNELFKAAQLDCTVAATDAIGDLIQSPFDLTVTVTNGTAGGDNKIALGGKAEVTITPDSGYLAPEDETGFVLSHVEIDAYSVDNDGIGHLTLKNADADCTVSCTCESSEPPIELTPMVEGDIYGSVTIAPVTKVAGGQSIDDWLAETIALGLQDGLIGGTYDETGILLLALEQDGVNMLLLDVNRETENEYFVFYIADTVGVKEKGWYTTTDGEDQSKWVSLTSPLDVNFASPSVWMLENASAESAFAKINGVVIGGDALSFEPLEVGDDISGGKTIYVKKVDSIGTVLTAILGENANVDIATCDSAYPKLYVAKTQDSIPYLAYQYDGTSGFQYIYNSPSGATGWNESIDENGALVLAGSVSGSIAALTGEGWNGVVIGKIV